MKKAYRYSDFLRNGGKTASLPDRSQNFREGMRSAERQMKILLVKNNDSFDPPQDERYTVTITADRDINMILSAENSSVVLKKENGAYIVSLKKNYTKAIYLYVATAATEYEIDQISLVSGEMNLSSTYFGSSYEIGMSGITQDSSIQITTQARTLTVNTLTFNLTNANIVMKKSNGLTLNASGNQATVDVPVDYYFGINQSDNKLIGNLVAQIAASYKHASEVLEKKFKYSQDSLFTTNSLRVSDSLGNNVIDCSTFVGLALRGIDYAHSPYALLNPNNTDYSATWNPASGIAYGTYGWEFSELDDVSDSDTTYDNATNIGITGKRTIRTAADMCKYLESVSEKICDTQIYTENKTDPDTFSYVERSDPVLNGTPITDVLQPGDIIFFSGGAWSLNGSKITASKVGFRAYGALPGDTFSINVVDNNGTIEIENADAIVTARGITVEINQRMVLNYLNSTVGTYDFTMVFSQDNRYKKVSHIGMVAERNKKILHVTTKYVNPITVPEDEGGDEEQGGDIPYDDTSVKDGGVYYSDWTRSRCLTLCCILRPRYRLRCENRMPVNKNLVYYPPQWSSQKETESDGITYTAGQDGESVILNGTKPSGSTSTRTVRELTLPPGTYEVSGFADTGYENNGVQLQIYDASQKIAYSCHSYKGIPHGTDSFTITESKRISVKVYIGSGTYAFTNKSLPMYLKLITPLFDEDDAQLSFFISTLPSDQYQPVIDASTVDAYEIQTLENGSKNLYIKNLTADRTVTVTREAKV